MPVHRWASCLNDITDFDGRSTAQEAESHLAVFLKRLLKARTRPPVSDGDMVFSSTKIAPPCFRSSSDQALSNAGIVLRS